MAEQATLTLTLKEWREWLDHTDDPRLQRKYHRMIAAQRPQTLEEIRAEFKAFMADDGSDDFHE